MPFSWTDVVNQALDGGIFYQDFNELIANVYAVKLFPKRIMLGGDPKGSFINTAIAIVDDPIYIEIDGTNLAGLTFELHFMGNVTAADTGTVELVSDPLGSPSVIVTKTFTNTTLDLVKSIAFTLTTGVNKYAVRSKANVGGVASPYVAYGFALVQK
jgi:hypothetical protein